MRERAGSATSISSGWIRPVLSLGLLGAVLACSGGNGPSGPHDTLPPQILILNPADNTTIVAPDGRPQFVVELSDGGSGIFDSSIQATLDGRDVSDAFRNGFSDDLGQIRVKSPVKLEDGGRLLVLSVADRAGNQARAQSRFTVTSVPPSEGSTR